MPRFGFPSIIVGFPPNVDSPQMGHLDTRQACPGRYWRCLWDQAKSPAVDQLLSLSRNINHGHGLWAKRSSNSPAAPRIRIRVRPHTHGTRDGPRSLPRLLVPVLSAHSPSVPPLARSLPRVLAPSLGAHPILACRRRRPLLTAS